jgi:pimeloyl-ACP methyl ester carboxylesterase
MADFIDHLKDPYQVIAKSLRGHGKSALGHSPLSLTQRANDAMAVIQAVTKDSVIVLGFSDGGYAAYQIGALYPDRVKKMIVIGAGEIHPVLRNFSFTAKKAFDMGKAYWDQPMKLMPEPENVQDLFTQIGNYWELLNVRF